MGNKNWDENDTLSIIVQGGLFKDNLIETSLNCRHWREIFPSAEIILAISSTNILERGRQIGLLSALKLTASHRNDGQMQAALDIIIETCTKIGIAAPALPLPPIKSDSPKANNMNLQISAAKLGLSMASATYSLRIRSDIIFSDKTFLAEYEKMVDLPRGRSAILEKRVMISWLFTLNPFTIERLPFHFSDWFHFGLTEDIKKLWDIPYVSLSDSIYYLWNQFSPESNIAERRFNTKLAVEQHAILHSLGGGFDNFNLDYHNDVRSVDMSIDILNDNFILSDLIKSNMIFYKYDHELRDHSKTYHCITPDDWQIMVRFRNVDYRITLAHKIEEAYDAYNYGMEEGFPRKFSAHRLYTKQGAHLNNEIVALEQNGVLTFGPHVSLPLGSYEAIVNFSKLEGEGTIKITVTLARGAHLAASMIFPLNSNVGMRLRVPFEILEHEGRECEVVCEMDGVRAASVTDIELVLQQPSLSSRSFPHIYPVALLEQTAAGRQLSAGDIAASLTFAIQNITLPFGSYVAALNPNDLDGTGTAIIQVRSIKGRRVLAERHIELHPDGRPDISIKFDAHDAASSEIDILCKFSGNDAITIAEAIIAKKYPAAARELPAWYPSRRLRTRVGVFKNDQISVNGEDGVLCFGPYVRLRKGMFRALVKIEVESIGGLLKIGVVARGGGLRLAEKDIPIVSVGVNEIELPFMISEATERDVEIVCFAVGAPQLAIYAVGFLEIPQTRLVSKAAVSAKSADTGWERKSEWLPNMLGHVRRYFHKV